MNFNVKNVVENHRFDNDTQKGEVKMMSEGVLQHPSENRDWGCYTSNISYNILTRISCVYPAYVYLSEETDSAGQKVTKVKGYLKKYTKDFGVLNPDFSTTGFSRIYFVDSTGTIRPIRDGIVEGYAVVTKVYDWQKRRYNTYTKFFTSRQFDEIEEYLQK